MNCRRSYLQDALQSVEHVSNYVVAVFLTGKNFPHLSTNGTFFLKQEKKTSIIHDFKVLLKSIEYYT